MSDQTSDRSRPAHPPGGASAFRTETTPAIDGAATMASLASACAPPADHKTPWRPMSRPIDLKHLGKLAEELGEAGSAVARCMIQGIDQREPETGKLNREWLEEELADVFANARLVAEHFGLDRARMTKRQTAKTDRLRRWHAELEPIDRLAGFSPGPLVIYGPAGSGKSQRAESLRRHFRKAIVSDEWTDCTAALDVLGSRSVLLLSTTAPPPGTAAMPIVQALAELEAAEFAWTACGA